MQTSDSNSSSLSHAGCSETVQALSVNNSRLEYITCWHCVIWVLKAWKESSFWWDQWRIQRGARSHAPCLNSWPCEERLWELLSSWLSVLTLAIIKCVAYSPPGKIMFSDFFFGNPSAFDWATVSLECQTGQTYWRSGPGHITLQCRRKYSNGLENAQKHEPKMEKKSGKGTLPLPYFFKGEGTTLPKCPLPHSYSLHASVAPLFLRFRQSTWLPCKSWMRPWLGLKPCDLTPAIQSLTSDLSHRRPAERPPGRMSRLRSGQWQLPVDR